MDRQPPVRQSSDRQATDGEDFEQIPWSSLVAEQTTGVDRRVYLVIGVVGVLVVVMIGLRMIGGTTQPVPIASSPVASSTLDSSPIGAVASPSSTVGVVVSEADLMANQPIGDPPADRLMSVAVAEWFITDYFTTDGSSETEKSIAALMPQNDTSDTQGLQRPPEGVYVEWARATNVAQIDGSSVRVRITRTDDGFVRDPVSAASVVLVTESDRAGVAGPPVTIPVPALEQTSASVVQPAGLDDGDGVP